MGMERFTLRLIVDDMSGLGNMDKGTLLAINPDGSVKWKYESEGMFTEPILDDNGNVFTSNYTYSSNEITKTILGFNKDGEKLFEYHGGPDYYYTFQVSKDLLLFNEGSTLIALNNKGDEVWSAELDSDYMRIVEDENGGIYAAVGGYSTPPNLVSLSRKDGSIHWEFTFWQSEANQNPNSYQQYQEMSVVEAGKYGIHVITKKDDVATYWMVNYKGYEDWKENFELGKEADLGVKEGIVYLSNGSNVRSLDEAFMERYYPYQPTNPFSHVKQVKVTDQVITGQNTEIHYPEFTFKPKQQMMDKLNQTYEKVAKEFKTNADELLKDAEEFGGLDMYDFSMEYEVTYTQQNLLSVLTTASEWAGGAHPISYRNGAVYDISTGDELTLKDFLGENYKEIVNTTIQNQLPQKGYNFFEPFTGIEEDPDFYLTENGIVIYFGLYEYTPYSDGFPEFTVGQGVS